MRGNINAAVEHLTTRRIQERFIKDLDSSRFVLFFQAIAALAAEEGAGYREILIRFKEEEQNLQSPGMFLPLLEEQGLLPQLDRWIVSRVLKWIQDLELKLGPGCVPRCGVNLSADTIRDESGFSGHVVGEIRKAGGRAEALSFEILESDAMDNPRALGRLMLPLRSVGCTFALCGHCGSTKAFELAASLGFATIKIDGSMLSGLLADPKALEGLTAVNRRCQEYGMRTVCMQVEAAETLEILRSIGVDYAQGFGVERPRLLEFEKGSRS